MTAVVLPPESEGAEQDQRTQGPERDHLASRARHHLAVVRRHQERAEAVQQDVSPNPAPAAIRQGRRDLPRHLALLVEVLGIRDRALSRADGLKDRGEDLISVQQQVDPVAARDARRGIGLDRRPERGISHRQVRQREMRLHPRTGARSQAEHGDGHEQPNPPSEMAGTSLRALEHPVRPLHSGDR
jgi:hypothetical protein